MTDKVLTPADVAEIRKERDGFRQIIGEMEDEKINLESYLRGTEASLKHAEAESENLKTRAELAEATITRLRGLIEGMGHEKSCAVSEWELRLWAYGRGNGPKPPNKPDCTCVKSKVNL